MNTPRRTGVLLPLHPVGRARNQQQHFLKREVALRGARTGLEAAPGQYAG